MNRVTVKIGSGNFDEINLVDVVSEAALRHAGFDDETVTRMALAVREAVANGVQHGNKMNPEKRVHITLKLAPHEVVVQIQDEGEGFDPGAVPDPLAAENLLKSRGRGIFLMRNLMDEVKHEFPDDGGTRLTLRKSITVDEESDEEEE